jgi:hypothetical protein
VLLRTGAAPVVTPDRRWAALAQDRDLWFTDCDTHAASSGGPIFIQYNDDLKLAAIMVGVAKHSYSIAVPIADWVSVEKRKCP